MGFLFKPRLISHRGNLKGKLPHLENKPEYIMAAIMEGYEVEIDLWVKDKILFLGHDEPQYKIHEHFLDNVNFWIHCKNSDALNYCRQYGSNWNYFWHDTDAYTLTSKGYVWAYPGQEIVPNSVVVLPERNNIKAETLKKKMLLLAICSDNIEEFREAYGNPARLDLDL
jgi:hypothetical protein